MRQTWTMREEREAGQLYSVAKAVLTPIFAFAWRIRVEGIEHVPAEGPAVLCPNHISFIDSLFLPSVLPRRITYVGKAEYLDSWRTRHLLPALGMIPIDRSGGDAAQAALDAASRILGRGELFGIYPEGTRSRDGLLHKGHTGAARLALRNRCPIIPVGIVGSDLIQPANRKVPRVFLPVDIRIGRPIDLTRYHERSQDRLVLRQITDEVMYEIRELSGQEYVDTYATRKPESIPRETVQVISGEETGGNGSAPRRSSAEVLAQRDRS